MRKVLIAEDELLIADQIEEILCASGYDVCGIARTVEEAVTLGELHKPNLAIIDVLLAKGGQGPEIARRLNGKANFGILYATASANRSLTQADGDAVISKPFRPENIVRALDLVWEIARAGTVTSPFPVGFHLLPECDSRFAQRLLGK